MYTEEHPQSEEEKLDIEAVVKFVNELNKQKIEPFEFILHRMLPSQTILKSGNKIYYSPDVKAGEIKVIELPTSDSWLKELGIFDAVENKQVINY